MIEWYGFIVWMGLLCLFFVIGYIFGQRRDKFGYELGRKHANNEFRKLLEEFGRNMRSGKMFIEFKQHFVEVLNPPEETL